MNDRRRGWNHPFFKDSRGKLEVIAHRGGAGQWPGETAYAFREAERLGVDALEMDVRSTKDGVLVLMHDKCVKTTTNGRGFVNRYTWDELKELDAGFKWTPDGGRSFPYRGVGIGVPRLEDIFAEFGHMRMVVEIKQVYPSVAAPLAALVRERGLEDRVQVASFFHCALREFRRASGGRVATSASVRELLKFVSLGGRRPMPGALPEVDAVQKGIKFGPFRLRFDEQTVADARALDLPVHAWTVNHRADIDRMLALGVDGIITDCPGRLLALLDRIPAAQAHPGPAPPRPECLS